MTHDSSFIFFANLSKRPVCDAQNKPVGRLWDFVINPQDQYPAVTRLVIAKPGWPRLYASVPWSEVAVLDSCVRLKVAASALEFRTSMDPQEFRIRKDILDQQVVDTFNHKVIRVNDVHLLAVNPPRIVHVDIGTRGLVRRMHWERAVDRMVKAFKPRADLRDNISMFRRLLERFVASVRTGQPAIDPQETLTLMQLLREGREALDQRASATPIHEIAIS